MEGDSTQVLGMDLWTRGRAAVQRIKVEPQLGIHNDWVIYPLSAIKGPAPAAQLK